MPNNSDSDPFVDTLEALLGAVVDKARTDKAFARKLARAVGDPGKLARAAKRRTDWRTEAPDVDVPSIFAKSGAEGVRSALRPLTQRQIYALVRLHDLKPARTSKFNKTQIIEHAVRALEPSKAASKRVFDY